MDVKGSEDPIPTSVKIYCSVLLIGVFILGTVGNMLTILSITLYSKLCRKVMHILLLPTSVCGFIIDILCVPTLGLHVVKYWPKWPLSSGMCTAVSFLTNTCTSVMAAMMLLFSIDRYYIIVKKKVFSKRNVVLIIFFCVVISCSLHGSYSFTSTTSEGVSTKWNGSTCNQLDGELLHSKVRAPIVFATSVQAVVMLLSLLVLMMTYCTWWKVKANDLNPPLRTTGNDLKTVTMMTAVCFGFWAPYWILLTFRTYETTKVKMVVISFILSLISTVIPPLSAILFMKTIRRAYLDILLGCQNTDPCIISCQKRDAEGDPLANDPAIVRDQYDDIDGTRRKFVKGNFKRGTKRVVMENVSIDSCEFSSDESQGHDNNSYDDLAELNPHVESKF